MRIESRLCHKSESTTVVVVKGWNGNKVLGSALGEGETAEIAEDNAIRRLNQRLNKNESKQYKIENNEKVYINNNDNNFNLKAIKENEIETEVISRPNDWGKELTEIDSEIKRLKWSREDEISFLQKFYGYNNRYKITNYDELLNYLARLKNQKTKDNMEELIITNESLIEESEILLEELSWDHNIGRKFLKNEFNVSTRKELNRNQLILFVNKLKEIRKDSLDKSP